MSVCTCARTRVHACHSACVDDSFVELLLGIEASSSDLHEKHVLNHLSSPTWDSNMLSFLCLGRHKVNWKQSMERMLRATTDLCLCPLHRHQVCLSVTS